MATWGTVPKSILKFIKIDNGVQKSLDGEKKEKALDESHRMLDKWERMNA